MQYTKDQLYNFFEELPGDVKEAMSSVETTRIILDMQKKYAFHVDQTGSLSNEILLLSLGLTPPQKFSENIEKRMRISPDVAQKVTVEVNEKIFRPIRESLMRIHKKRSEKHALENVAENKLSGSFSLPKKPATVPGVDPYRETF
jgi:hypothetical protein